MSVHAGGGRGHGYSRPQMRPPATAFFYHTRMWQLRVVLRQVWLGLEETGQLGLAAFSLHLTAFTYTRVSGTGWHQPSSQHPQAQGKEEGDQLLTDPRSQSPALPCLALCLATGTWVPTSPQSLTPRPCKGESGQRQVHWTRHHSHPHPRHPACLIGFPTALPMLQPQEMAGSSGTLLLCSRPTPGALRQPVWDTNCSPNSWVHSLLFITHASASPLT